MTSITFKYVPSLIQISQLNAAIFVIEFAKPLVKNNIISYFYRDSFILFLNLPILNWRFSFQNLFLCSLVE